MGNSLTAARGLAIDSDDRVYVTGWLSDNTFPGVWLPEPSVTSSLLLLLPVVSSLARRRSRAKSRVRPPRHGDG